MSIQALPTLPTPPDPASDSKAEFLAKAQAFTTAQKWFGDQLNENFIPKINLVASLVEAVNSHMPEISAAPESAAITTARAAEATAAAEQALLSAKRAILAADSAESATGLPQFGLGDGGKSLIVKGDLSGYELGQPAKILGQPIVKIPSIVAQHRMVDVLLSAPTIRLQGVDITTYHVSIDGGDVVDVPAAADNTATFVVTTDKPIGSILKITVTATDSLGNTSMPATADATVVAAYIVTPTITSPTTNASLNALSVPVATTAFSVDGGTDVHASTDWMVTTDSARANIIYQNMSSSALLAITLPAIALSSAGPRHIWARHNGMNLGPSGWAHVEVLATGSRHGEIFLDKSGKPLGVIIGSYHSGGKEPWNIRGRRVWIFVALAKMANSLAWEIPGGSNVYTKVECGIVNNKLAAAVDAPDGTGNHISAISTEQSMDAAVSLNTSGSTSRSLTTSILTANTKFEAAGYCRTIFTSDDIAMDLPSPDVLMRIYQSRYILDAFGIATGGSALSYYLQFNAYYVHSSANMGISYAFGIRTDKYGNTNPGYAGMISSDTKSSGPSQYPYLTIPILEIDA